MMQDDVRQSIERELTEYDQLEVKLLQKYHSADVYERRIIPHAFRVMLFIIVLVGWFLPAGLGLLCSFHMVIGWVSVGIWFRSTEENEARLRMLEELLLTRFDDSPTSSVYAQFMHRDHATRDLQYLRRYEPALWGVINTLIVVGQIFL